MGGLRHGRPPRIRGWARVKRGGSRWRYCYLRLYQYALRVCEDEDEDGLVLWVEDLPGWSVAGSQKKKEVTLKGRSTSSGAGGVTIGGTEKVVVGLKNEKEYGVWKKAFEDAVRVVDSYYRVLRYRKLGTGAFSDVFFGFDLENGDHAAVKFVDKAQCSRSELDHAELEARMSACISHPHIVETLDIFDAPNSLHIIMEYMAGGTLEDKMNGSLVPGEDSGRPRPFSEPVAKRIMLNVLSALEYLHRSGICHRDIKPDNVLLGAVDNEAKWPTEARLSDFGLAAFVGSDCELSEVVGTPAYLAPEIISRDENKNRPGYGAPVDVWAAGVMMYWMMSGRLPFDGKNSSEVFRAIRKAELKFEGSVWKAISSDAKNLMAGLLNKSPTIRLSALGALAHPWLNPSKVKRSPVGPDGALRGRLRSWTIVWRIVIFAMIAWRGIFQWQNKRKKSISFSDFKPVEYVVNPKPKEKPPEVAPTGLNGLGYNVGFIPSFAPRSRARRAPQSSRASTRSSSDDQGSRRSGSSAGSATSQAESLSGLRRVPSTRPPRAPAPTPAPNPVQLDSKPRPRTTKQPSPTPRGPGVSTIAYNIGLLPMLTRKASRSAHKTLKTKSRVKKSEKPSVTR